MLEEIGIPRLVVGGLGSGSGKTSISLGLTAALRARGRNVQTFKVGGDFIATAYLAHARPPPPLPQPRLLAARQRRCASLPRPRRARRGSRDRRGRDGRARWP